MLLEALERGEGRYVGTALIDDTVPDAELERLAKAGVRGARFNFLASLGLNWDRARFEPPNHDLWPRYRARLLRSLGKLGAPAEALAVIESASRP